jgi:NAD-dependent deacetylase
MRGWYIDMMPTWRFSPELIERFRAARKVVVLTGAGISAESGIPTFRGDGGLWRTFRPEDLATVEALHRNPRLVWEWYLSRRDHIRTASPNPGHFALVEWEKQCLSFTLVTQNVDGLHRRAGSRNVLELHGNIMQSRCDDCFAPLGDLAPGTDGVIPRCSCGGMARPDVVLFGELLPPEALQKAEEAALGAELFFSVGTSSVVYPAADIPRIAARHGAFTVEINPTPTELSDIFDETLRGPSGQILPELLAMASVAGTRATTC